MVAVAHREDLVGPAVRGGQQQGRVVGLGAGGGEEDPGLRDAGERGDPLGEFDHGPVQIERGGVDDPPGLLTDRLGDLGQRVGRHRGEDAAEEVEVAVALRVPDMTALAVGDLQRVPVVERQPLGTDGEMATVQTAHGSTSPS